MLYYPAFRSHGDNPRQSENSQQERREIESNLKTYSPETDKRRGSEQILPHREQPSLNIGDQVMTNLF